MLVLVGLLLAVMSAGALALHVLGLAALVERRWRSAALELGGAVVASMVVFVALALAARLLMRGDLGVEGVPVEMKARALGVCALFAFRCKQVLDDGEVPQLGVIGRDVHALPELLDPCVERSRAWNA